MSLQTTRKSIKMNMATHWKNYLSLHALRAPIWQPANPRHDSPARDVSWVPALAWEKHIDIQPREKRTLRVSYDIWPQPARLSPRQVGFRGPHRGFLCTVPHKWPEFRLEQAVVSSRPLLFPGATPQLCLLEWPSWKSSVHFSGCSESFVPLPSACFRSLCWRVAVTASRFWCGLCAGQWSGLKVTVWLS